MAGQLHISAAKATDDHRTFGFAAVAQGTATNADHAFEADGDRGMHFLRCIGRTRLLMTGSHRGQYIQKNAEGVDMVDIDIKSDKIWRRFVDALLPTEQALLLVYRCGAVSTATRRQRHTTAA